MFRWILLKSLRQSVDEVWIRLFGDAILVYRLLSLAQGAIVDFYFDTERRDKLYKIYIKDTDCFKIYKILVMDSILTVFFFDKLIKFNCIKTIWSLGDHLTWSCLPSKSEWRSSRPQIQIILGVYGLRWFFHLPLPYPHSVISFRWKHIPFPNTAIQSHL